MEQPSKYIRRAEIVFWIAVISSWLTFLFFFSIPFGLLFWIAAFVYLFLKGSRLKWFLLLVSSWTLVPVWSFVAGSKDYFQGKAAIETFGMPDREFYNLDPDLRVWNSSSGCVVLGFEPFTQVPNNWAVRSWTSLLGPQSGVYKGIYPTREEAKKLIVNGDAVKLSKKFERIFMNYRNESLSVQGDDDDLCILAKAADAKAYVLNNECLLMEAAVDSTRRVILLADKSNGKVFARYFEKVIR